MKIPRLTTKALDAIADALAAALAGEEGEGDMAGTSFADLEQAQRWVRAEKARRASRKRARTP
jgi:hypothetical protein